MDTQLHLFYIMYGVIFYRPPPHLTFLNTFLYLTFPNENSHRNSHCTYVAIIKKKFFILQFLGGKQSLSQRGSGIILFQASTWRVPKELDWRASAVFIGSSLEPHAIGVLQILTKRNFIFYFIKKKNDFFRWNN